MEHFRMTKDASGQRVACRDRARELEDLLGKREQTGVVPNICKGLAAAMVQQRPRITQDIELPQPYLADFEAALAAYNPLRTVMNFPEKPSAEGMTHVVSGGLDVSELGMSVDATAFWQPDSGDPTPGTVGTYTKSERNGFLLIAILELSAANFADCYGSADRLLLREAARVMGLAEQLALVSGAGSGDDPVLGLYGQDGISKTNYSASVLDELFDLAKDLEDAGSQWNAVLLSPKETAGLRKLKTNNQYAFPPGQRLTLAGRPVLTCSKIPQNLGYGTPRIAMDGFSEAMTGKVRFRFSFYSGLSLTPGHVDDFKILDLI
jgi:HK97 family phage major capsid protein